MIRQAREARSENAGWIAKIEGELQRVADKLKPAATA